VKLDHEVDVKSRYFRDPAGQLFALHTADRTPDSRANHCIRLEPASARPATACH